MSRSRAFCHCEWHPRTVQDAVSRCAAAALCAEIFQSRHTLAPLLKVYTSPARCGFSSGNVKSSILRPCVVPKAQPPALVRAPWTQGGGVEDHAQNDSSETPRNYNRKVALATQWKRGGVGVALGMSSEGFPHGAEELYASSVVQGLHGVHWPAFLVAVVLGPHPPCSCPRLGHVCSGCLPALLCSRAHERYSGLLIKYGTDWEQKAIRFNMGGEGDEESRE